MAVLGASYHLLPDPLALAVTWPCPDAMRAGRENDADFDEASEVPWTISAPHRLRRVKRFARKVMKRG